MEKQTSYVDLPAIITGVGVALAISIVLLHFGSVIGLAMSPDTVWDQETIAGQVITINLWSLWVQILASLIGGYIAGRMRVPVAGSNPHEREMRDGVHGLAVWAFGVVFVAIGAAVVAALVALSPEASAAAERAADVIQTNERVATITGFSTAAIALVSALAAWFAATKGGEHRDDSVDLSRYVSFRR